MYETKNYKKGDIIFAAGQPGDCMYDILDGSVGIYKNYGTADSTQLVELSSTEYFGELAIIDDSPRSATAVALTDCKLMVITKDTFTSYMQENPAKFLTILQTTSNRLRKLTKDYYEASIAIKEYVDDQEADKEHSKELLAKMKEIASVG